MRSILVVDDERIEREGIKRLIDKSSLDLDVFEANNGVEALNFMKKYAVNILLTDIEMPFMDGLELSFKAREIVPRLKTIIFSAHSEFGYAQKAIESNVISYILKPIQFNEFNRVMTNTLRIWEDGEETRKYMLYTDSGYKKTVGNRDSLYSCNPRECYVSGENHMPSYDGGELCRSVINEVISIVESEYMNELSLDYIAEKVYLTPCYLSFVFKKETNCNLIKYITKYRLGKVCDLLNNTNIKITNIAKMVGYSHLPYFYTLFNNNFGMTPTQYRERAMLHDVEKL